MSESNVRVRRAQRPAIEWLTVFLALIIYGSWFGLTFFHSYIPGWLLAALGSILIAWHSSFQHEVVHGHPTRWRLVNFALGFPPLSLWLPFEIYRISHRKHHIDERLTDPLDDPESKYLTETQWHGLAPIARMIERAQSPLIGRILIGPFWMVGKFIIHESRKIVSGDRSALQIWLVHGLSVATVCFWLIVICKFPVEQYILLFVYPGTAILMLRAFAEHRAAKEIDHRTAVIENASFLGLIFLNNNLHAVHHRNPGLAWYKLPEVYRDNREFYLSKNAGFLYRGYREIIAQYIFQPHDELIHPLRSTATAAGSAAGGDDA